MYKRVISALQVVLIDMAIRVLIIVTLYVVHFSSISYEVRQTFPMLFRCNNLSEHNYLEGCDNVEQGIL